MILKQLLSILLVLLFAKNLYKRCMHLYDLTDGFHEYLNASVAKDHFTFYSFPNEGHFKLKLVSTHGDADIYVSSSGKPSYHPDSYEIASATCGVDVVDLDAAMPRPAFIGIYGAGHTAWSNYTLFVMLEAHGREQPLSAHDKMTFMLRYATMWRVFDIFESVLFIL